MEISPGLIQVKQAKKHQAGGSNEDLNVLFYYVYPFWVWFDCTSGEWCFTIMQCLTIHKAPLLCCI